MQGDNREDRDAQADRGRSVRHPVALGEVKQVLGCAVVVGNGLGVGLTGGDGGRNGGGDAETRNQDLRVGLDPVDGELDGVLDRHGCASFLRNMDDQRLSMYSARSRPRMEVAAIGMKFGSDPTARESTTM